MPTQNLIYTYHGTSAASVNSLISGAIDVSQGGGELGVGFYAGTELHIAKAWAWRRHRSQSVVEFQMTDSDFWSHDVLPLSPLQTRTIYLLINSAAGSRTFTFGRDVVWGPIVGGSVAYCDQFKWESKIGERYINSARVTRRRR